MMGRMLSPWFMLDHRWTRRHISDYFDEELDAGGRRRVERHVHMCPSCHKLLATLQKTLDGLHGLGREPLPAEGIGDSVIERFRGTP